MARLKAQADILYYPTAEPIVRLIATWFNNPARSRLADPCCGKGEALATFAQAVGGESETWGVEISYSRAEAAQRVLDVVLPASFYAVTWGQRTVSLAFENPPYDWSSMRDEHGKHLRHEWLFVSQMTPRIVPGGHHVILVPRSMLIDERFVRHLVGWYRENLIFRSGEDYDRFKQVVILAAHRKERYEPPTKDQIESITGLADDSVTLPELVAGDGRFVIPTAPQAGRFQYQPATPEDLLRAAARCEVAGSDDYHRATYVRPPGAPINVAVPEKIGHMTMEISSGEVGVLSIDTPDGAILMKGMSSKAVDESAEAHYDGEGEYSHTKVEARERLVTIITVAHPDGRLERLDKPDAVGDFITRHAGAIADALLKRNRPTYDWRPTEREWDIASFVALGLPPLPGREARGLFDAQKHFAIAAARVMRKYRQCIINAEMGFGKCQPLDAKILTPTGWTTMEQIQVGDKVIGADGRPTTVLGVYPQGAKEIYRVTFSDGSSTECSDNHLWRVNTPLRKSRKKEGRVLSLREIRTCLRHRNNNLQHFVPIVQPVEFEERPLPLDPYVLGVLLGDGGLSHTGVHLTTADEQILAVLRDLLPHGLRIKSNGRQYHYSIVTHPLRRPHPLRVVLDSLGLWGARAESKFIPNCYMVASVETRVALLQGLLDTDGNVTNHTSVEYTTVSKELAHDVLFIVQSLGGTASITQRQTHFTYKGERRTGRVSYRLNIRLPVSIAPFRLTRKLEALRVRTKYADVTRAIASVEYVGRKLAQCIRVSAPDGLYVTDDFIVTHNTSTSIGALEELDEWPALVLCPGHMIEKWRRDLERASDPHDPIAVRIITRPARSEASRWHTQIVPAIEEAGGHIVDTTRTQVAPVTINDPGGRRRVVVECNGSSAARLVKVLQTLCTFRDNGHTQPLTIQFTASGLVVEFVDRDDFTLFDFAADYQAGHLGCKAAAVIAFDPAKYGAGPMPVKVRQWRRVWNEDKGAYERQHLIVCPTCGKGHSTLPWRCDNVIQEPILDAGGKKTGERSRMCNTPLYEMSRWRRVGLSRLVQRKFKALFKAYVADECFPADTPIATPQGNVPIQAIRVGDEVLTEKDGVVTIRKVSRLYRKPLQGNLVKIVHTDGELVCTPNHRIYVKGEFVRADALLAGDELTLVRMHDDHQALQDVREPLPGTEFPTANMPTDLRQATRGAHARRHRQLPCMRQRVHRNQDQGQATNDLQSDLWREVSSHARNSSGESQTWSQEATHIPDLPCVRTTIREHTAQVFTEVLLPQVCKQGEWRCEQGMDTRCRMARQGLTPNEGRQSNGRSVDSRESCCEETESTIRRLTRRQRPVDSTTVGAGECSGLASRSRHTKRQPQVASSGRGHRKSRPARGDRGRRRLSSQPKAEEPGPKEGQDAEKPGLEAGEVLELGSRQRLIQVRVLRVEPVRSKVQYVYNFEVEDTHRYFAKGVLVSNCHKAMDGRSDIGTADGRLVSAIPYGLALTGTLFGGTGGSLFHLLYRRNVEVRRLYRYKDKTRWVDHYGLWKMTWSQNEPLSAGRGLSTGIERWNYRQDELPGVSPAVIRFLLPITLFGKITDLGYTLPPLHEHIERLKMPKALKKQYEGTDRQLLSEAMRLAMQDHDPGGLSIWFATMRFRPASAYRDEVAAYNSRRGRPIQVELPAITGPDLPWLPKEVHLAEIVRNNRERGRKTLVFVEQSGTRDIRPRLQQALEALILGGTDDTILAEVDTSRALLGANPSGVALNVPIRVGTLSSSDMSPAKRETWITLEAPNMDALLVNPKLIETGLDLLAFSHVVFFELSVSLYTLWQAQRRVWRLGQRNEVDVTFLVYKDTIEEALLQRVGAKMKHAMLLYGDEASGSLIEADDDDLQREMIRAALEGKTYETVGELVNGIFTTGAESTTAVTESPMGGLAAMSPHMSVLNIEDVLQLDLFGGHVKAMEVVTINPKRRR